MTRTPHDALFKAVFENPEHARGALQTALTPVLRAAIDWTTLERLPGSFVDQDLVERHTDLLFSASWRGGGEALVHLLFEHQSTPDSEMAYRLLRYEVRIWERWRAEHPDEKRLPAIIPIVLYHGKTAWPVPRTFEALLDVPEDVWPALQEYSIQFTYIVDDLSVIPEKELRDRAMMTALGKLIQVGFQQGPIEDVPVLLLRWADELRSVVGSQLGLRAVSLLMSYILKVNEYVTSSELEAALERALGDNAKDIMMTAGDKLIEQGVQQGARQRERTLLLLQLRARFGNEVGADTEQRLAAASTQQIEAWAVRLLTAKSLTELFADEPTSSAS